MPNQVINALVAPDSYNNASTIRPTRKIDHISIDVVNAGIYWQLYEYSSPNDAETGYITNEVFMAPGSKIIDRDGLCGIRFRAAIPLADLPASTFQAVVTVEAVD